MIKSEQIRNTRTSICLLVFAICLFPFIANAAEQKKTILFINPGYADKGFWQSVSQTMQAASNELNFDLKIISANRSWSAMVTKGIATLSHHKPDYLILVNEQQKAAPLLKYAIDHSIPTLMLLNSLTAEQKNTFGNPREKSPYWLGSIEPDNEVAGYEMLVSLSNNLEQLGYNQEDLAHKKVPLLTLAGDLNTPASLNRLLGLDRGLKDHPYFREIRRMTVHWSFDESYERTKFLVNKTKNIKAVWAANDAIALGAIKALREAALIPGQDVNVVGLNWSKEALDLVETGEMTLTHGGHFLAGAWSIIMLYDYDKGHDFSYFANDIMFPMTAITQKNVKDYKKHFKDGDWSKINFKAFTRTHNSNLKEYPFRLDYLLKATNH